MALRRNVTLQRLLQIGAAAAIGGSFMFVATQLTAPGIAAALDVSLGSLGSSVALSEFMVSILARFPCTSMYTVNSVLAASLGTHIISLSS